MGDEPYFIDRLAGYFERDLLQEEEKSFNQQVFYGRDVEIGQIIEAAKRYPMMAERQLVLVKEAQALSRNIEKLLPYAENPQPSTVLVFCYKYKSLDKRTKLYKTLNKNGVVFESKRLYENQVPAWIESSLKEKGHPIAPKASHMLVEFLGTDLGKIDKELEKLTLIVEPGKPITPEIIEENIGISKDFNNFELQNAIGERDIPKAHRIVNYFGQNPKDNPMVVTTAILHNFFAKILQYHSLGDKSKNNVASKLGVNPFFVKDYAMAARNIPMKKASQNIAFLRQADAMSKGVGAANVPQGDLLKELLVKIMD
jgi:DNA polymerase-3 subunit delta